ncbi:sigma 54-interacting transcriptional regulator [Helicovermis profundi]
MFSSISIDIRIIADTNKHLENLIDDEYFRSDLYF